MENEKISVIVPVYNKEKYLECLFNDFKEQTFSNFEVLLIDDGSKDNSGNICDEISEVDHRFKVFHLENGGVSNARNYGMCKATGTYITFVDADDRIYPKYLENLFQIITNENVDIVISGVEKYWINSVKKVFSVPPFKGKYKKQQVLQQFAEQQEKTGIYGCCVAKIFRKDLVEEIEFDRGLNLAEDFDFYLKLYRKVNSFYFDDQCYYRYLQCADNSTALIEDSKINYLAQLELNLRYKKFLQEEGVFFGDNQRIVENKIGDYVYFVLFHSTNYDIDDNYKKMKQLLVAEGSIIRKGKILERIVLYLFEKNQLFLIKTMLISYKRMVQIVKHNRGNKA